MSTMESIKQTFFLECEDLLRDLESGLIAINDGDEDMETVNSVFRAVHSIKGGAGAFEMTDLVGFSHIFENTLDEIRSDRLEASKEVLNVLLQSSDMLLDLFEDAKNNTTECDLERAEALKGELQAFIGSPEATEAEAPLSMDDMDFEPVALDFGFGDDAGIGEIEPNANQYTIRFSPTSTLYAHGNESALLLRNLRELGEVSLICDLSTLPDLDELEPENAYFTWTATLSSPCSEDEIREIFEFVEDDCELDISVDAPSDSANDQAQDNDNAEDGAALGASLDALFGIATPLETQDAPFATDDEPSDVKKNAEPSTMTQDNTETAPTSSEAISAPADKASDKSADKKAPTPQQSATIRVNLERVDRLINLVGELVINQAMLSECVIEAGISRNPSVSSGLDEFKQLTREIQESVMAIRAQPVQPLFQRMSRVVRKAAAATNKSVRLALEGEFTEVDKTIVEKLADPLTHMIRNAVDHGIESAEKRAETDKPAEGTVTLSAAHRSGKIIIEVSDDGAGINRERVKQIAVDKELIAPDAQLTDNEIDNLLFMPGFSTVETVSTLSGRGVGMDVVKKAIQSIGGRVNISSTPGKGSSFTISLPLTLAILDGMLVQAAGQTLVVPLTAIVETLIPKPEDIHAMGGNSRVINNRGTFIPMIDIGYELGFRDEPVHNERSVVLSVETDGGVQTAILVDGIQDQRQVVIKSLENNYGHVPSIAAATILGDGRIALILDVDGLVASASLPNVSDFELPAQAAE